MLYNVADNTKLISFISSPEIAVLRYSMKYVLDWKKYFPKKTHRWHICISQFFTNLNLFQYILIVRLNMFCIHQIRNGVLVSAIYLGGPKYAKFEITESLESTHEIFWDKTCDNFIISLKYIHSEHQIQMSELT